MDFRDDEEFAAFLRELFPPVPADRVPRPPTDPELLERLRIAVEEFRVSITTAGEVVENVDGFPSGMTEPQTIHPGEIEPVPGEWTSDDWPDGWTSGEEH